MSALYIHIPFCKTRCNYCDFYKSTSCAKSAEYIEALEREMAFRKDFFQYDPIDTVFFGGGTPSLYSPEMLQRILNKADEVWGLNGVSEISVEVNPDDVTQDYLASLSHTSVNRISFGIQSFLDRDLRLMGRRHTSSQAVDAVKRAQDSGFSNISVDLIFGIPGMSLREWESNVFKAMLLGVRHISAYALTVDDESVFGRWVAEGRMNLESDDMLERQYLIAHQILTDGGFNHYEISNYALGEESRCAHNCAYWCGKSYLGLGPSAHSYDGTQRVYVVSDLEKYLQGAGTDTIYGREILSKTDKYNEFVMTALRTCCGVRRDIMTEKFGFESLLYFEYAAEKFIRNGLIVRDGNEYRIPPEKFFISNSIISDLFYVEE